MPKTPSFQWRTYASKSAPFFSLSDFALEVHPAIDLRRTGLAINGNEHVVGYRRVGFLISYGIS